MRVHCVTDTRGYITNTTSWHSARPETVSLPYISRRKYRTGSIRWKHIIIASVQNRVDVQQVLYVQEFKKRCIYDEWTRFHGMDDIDLHRLRPKVWWFSPATACKITFSISVSDHPYNMFGQAPASQAVKLTFSENLNRCHNFFARVAALAVVSENCDHYVCNFEPAAVETAVRKIIPRVYPCTNGSCI